MQPTAQREPIRVGVINSQAGTLSISARPVIDATLLAINEINERGGILGRQIEAIVADGKSDNAIFAREAEKLIVEKRSSRCSVAGRPATVTACDRSSSAPATC